MREKAFRTIRRPKNRGHFRNKLVFIGILKNCDYFWIRRSISNLSNSSEITKFEHCGLIVNLLRLRRVNRSCARFYWSPILKVVLWLLCLSLWMKVLHHFLSLPYWRFQSQFMVESETYVFSRANLKLVQNTASRWVRILEMFLGEGIIMVSY